MKAWHRSTATLILAFLGSLCAPCAATNVVRPNTGASAGVGPGAPLNAGAAAGASGALAADPSALAGLSGAPLVGAMPEVALPPTGVLAEIATAGLELRATAAETAAPAQSPAGATTFDVHAGAAANPASVVTVSQSGAHVSGSPGAAADGVPLQSVRGQDTRRLLEHFQVLEAAFGLKRGDSNLNPGHALAADILGNFAADMLDMADRVPYDAHIYEHVLGKAAAALDGWADHVDGGRAVPRPQLRLDERDPLYQPGEREITLAVYPVAGDPMQLGHLLVGLNAAQQFGADMVTWVGAGDDPRKPKMTPAQTRIPILEATLARFGGLFGHSRIAQGTNFKGELNVFRIMALNPFQPMRVIYMAGDDHYARTKPDGSLDVIGELENNLANLMIGHNPLIHRIEVAFIRRTLPKVILPGDPNYIATAFPQHWLEHVGFEASSTDIRTKGLYYLMHAVGYQLALAAGLYGLGAGAKPS